MSLRSITRAPLPPLLGTPLGHLWTIAYHLDRRRQSLDLGSTQPFMLTFADPLTGDVTLSGTLHTHLPASNPSTRSLVVVIHGLGGSANSGYMFEAAKAALDLGLDVLRVNLRGADVTGTDFYHAGLYADVLRVLNHETVQSYRNVYLLGISLGGHVALRTAGADVPSNLRSVAALCPPLDLGACSAAFDKKRQWLFRRHVLDSLKQSYARFAATHAQTCQQLGLPSASSAHAIHSIGQWDRAIVAPRHGFESAARYYETQSVGPRLGEIRRPALILTTRWDPMVPYETTVHLLKPQPTSPLIDPTAEQSEAAEGSRAAAKTSHEHSWTFRPLTPHVRHVELAVGGHIAFPQISETSVFTQSLQWLKQHVAN